MKKPFHFIMIMALTVFSAVLFLINRMLGLDIWILPVFLVELFFCWYLFISKRGSEKFAIYNCSFFLMVEVFYYAVHVDTIYDSTAVIVMMIFLFAASGEGFLLPTGTITGLAGMLMHLWLSGEFESLTQEPSQIVRTGWQFLLVLLSALVAKKIISAWEDMARKYQMEIEDVRKENGKVNNFLANVSHEIRTPVNAVIGMSAVLEKEQLPQSVHNELRAISKAGHRVAEQISDILDFTEIDMEKLSVNKGTYMINSVVNDLMTQVSFMEKNGLELVVDMEASIPSVMVGDESKIKKILWHLIGNGFKFTSSGGVYVHIYTVKKPYGVNLVLRVEDTGIGMDDAEIGHIYDKFYQSDSGRSRMAGGLGLGVPIVSGFVKAMGGILSIESEKGRGTQVQVILPQEVVNEAPCISVREKEKCVVAGFLGFITTNHSLIRDYYMDMITHLIEGLGIPFLRVQSIEELQKLLETGKVTHLFVGTGEYLENRAYIDSFSHKIHIAVVAERDLLGQVKQGIIVLDKPFYGSQVANVLNQTEKPGYNMEEHMRCPGVRALVVDDEPMNLMVAQGIFESYGMVVTTVGSGAEAISICERQNFDIIFMDHMMPEMDGVEAMKRLRLNAVKKKSELCIIALTANAISSAKEMFLAEGFDGFIPKPIEITDLERVLKHVLPKAAIVYERTEITTTGEEIEEPVEETKKDYFTTLKEQGVDVETGLKYCRENEEFYRQLLQEYASPIEEKLQQLQTFYDAEDWQNYAIRVHAVKSTSKMIGAGAVSEMARELELASKAKDEHTVKELHAPFMEKYARLLRAICGDEKSYGEEDHADKDVVEFTPASKEDDVVEFAPVEKEDDVVEFAPVEKEDDVVEFAPVEKEDDVVEFAPVEKNDEVLELGPKEGEEN